MREKRKCYLSVHICHEYGLQERLRSFDGVSNANLYDWRTIGLKNRPCGFGGITKDFSYLKGLNITSYEDLV